MRRPTLGAMACAVAVLASCSKPEPPPREQAVPVRVQRPVRVERPSFVAVSGTVEANETVDLAFQVAGRVVRVAVEEGQAVRKGQVIAELDAADYRFGLQAAEAQTGVARASLEKAQAGTRSEEVEQARAAFERARDEYDRYRQLYERKSMPPVDFAKVEAAFRTARAQYEMAQNGARVEDRHTAESAVRAAEAQANVSRKRLADTRLLATVAGVVARRGVDPGEMVGPGIPVFTLVDLNPARVRVGVPESDIAGMRPGQRATVIVPALNDREFQGTVELVGVAADPASRTFSAKIVVPNPGNILRAGMIAEATIQGSDTVSAITLPGDAIVRDPQGATLVYVYFPDRKRVFARRVEAGTVRGRDVEIRSGLTGEELVVTAGQNRVRDGAAVEVAR